MLMDNKGVWIFILLGVCCDMLRFAVALDISGRPGSGGRGFPIGTRYQITCNCSTCPCSVALHRNRTEIARQTDACNPLVYNSTLSWEDNGVGFRCTELDNEPATQSDLLYYKVLYKPIRFSQSFKKKVKPGEEVQMTMSVWANPDNVTFEWTFPDGKIKTSEPKGDGPISSDLTINVKLYGIYKCKVSNAVGSSVFSFHLQKIEGSDPSPQNILLPVTTGSIGGAVVIAVFIVVVVVWRRKTKDRDYENVQETPCCLCCMCCTKKPDMAKQFTMPKPPENAALQQIGHGTGTRYFPNAVGLQQSFRDSVIAEGAEANIANVQHDLRDQRLAALCITTAELHNTEPGQKKRRAYENIELVCLNENIRLETNAQFNKTKELHTDTFAELWSVNIRRSKMPLPEQCLMKQTKNNLESKRQLWLELVALSTAGEHRHLTSLIAFQETTRVIRIIFPHYKYGLLSDFLFEHRTGDFFHQAYVLSFARDVADAMEFLHSQQPAFLHPNLDLDQVFLEDSGDGLSCQLSGFLLQDDVNTREQAQRQGNVMKVYRPPEILNQQEHTKSTDVWDFGMLFYQLITLGNLPVVAESDENTRQFIKIGELIPPPQPCSPQTREIVSACLSPDASYRPSFDAVRCSIDNLFRSKDVHINIKEAQHNLFYENNAVIAPIARKYHSK